MDFIFSGLSLLARRAAESITPYFSGMTPDDVTELFKQIILSTAIFFAVILLFNAVWRIVGLIAIRHKIKALASKNEHREASTSAPLFFSESRRPNLAALSSRTQRFSEILVADNGILYAAQDVEAVSHALWEPPLLRSRLIPAGAAILTGLGVLGTFAGLLLGLGGLQLDGNMEHLQAEIRQVAQGASVAFETSVWGVSLSLALTLLEKVLGSWVARSLLSLQALLVELFPIFPLPGIMRDICDASRKAADQLAVLAEQIGKNMQESLDSFSITMRDNLTESLVEASNRISQAISDSLTETLQATLIPSIDRMSSASQDLATRQAHSSEEALGHLLSEFTGRMGEAGNSQKEAMQEASQEMQRTMATFADSMNGLVRSLQEQQRDFEQRQQAQMERLDAAFRQMNEEQGRNMGKASEDMLNVLASFRDGVREELGRQAADMGKVSDDIRVSLQDMSVAMKDFFSQLEQHQQHVSSAQDDRARVLESQMQQVFNQQSHTLESMETTISAHISATQNLLEQGETLQRHIGAEESLLKDITTSMSSAGDSLRTASSHLQSFGEHIRTSIDRNAQSTERAVAVAQEIGRQESAVAQELRNIITGMSPLQSGLEKVTHSLSSSVSTARDAYSQLSTHYEALQRNLHGYMEAMQQQNRQYLAEIGAQMTQQVEALDRQMGELLSDYARLAKAQLDERMNAWNAQTRNFCDKMQSTAEAMAEVVDAMDSQPRR